MENLCRAYITKAAEDWLNSPNNNNLITYRNDIGSYIIQIEYQDDRYWGIDVPVDIWAAIRKAIANENDIIELVVSANDSSIISDATLIKSMVDYGRSVNLKNVKDMHTIICNMNDERAYHTWIYTMPDCPSEEDFEDFAHDQSSYNDLAATFKRIVNRFRHAGLYLYGLFDPESSFHLSARRDLMELADMIGDNADMITPDNYEAWEEKFFDAVSDWRF